MSEKKKVVLYTDGACSGNPGLGGYGGILIYGNARKEYSGSEKETTNNRMELTAVIEALKLLPWSDSELAQLTEQQQYVKAVPQVPGSYFTSRHVYNALRRVLTYGDDPRQTLIDYADYIDEEIKTKRDEFGLD